MSSGSFSVVHVSLAIPALYVHPSSVVVDKNDFKEKNRRDLTFLTKIAQCRCALYYINIERMVHKSQANNDN